MVGIRYGSRTFAAHLKQFSRSVDIVDRTTFDGVRDLIIDYLKRELGPNEYFELLRDRPVGAEMVLDTFWSSEDRVQLLPVPRSDGPFETPAAMSFATEKPLWVVPRDKEQSLDGCPPSDYEDQWSQVTDLPPHQSPTKRRMKTLITLPLRRKRPRGVLYPLGLFYMESPRYLIAEEPAQNEFSLLADALATLLELWEVNETHSRLTVEAVHDLQEAITSAEFPRLTTPQVFVAHSKRADPQVTQIMREVLERYQTESKIEVTYWDEINESGNVTVQIGEKIVKSRFGLCYLSEPADRDRRTKYVDNPNVVFEAGMLHGLRNAPNAPPSDWVPIRERESPPAPFDFAQERILEVARLASGEVAPNFGADLQKRMNALLASSAPR
jgi:hypothetical protein